MAGLEDLWKRIGYKPRIGNENDATGVPPMTVVKVGGRIVESPELSGIVQSVLHGRTSRIVLIAGGGRAADLVRDLDRTMGLSEEDAHWVAIRAMSLQAELLARRLRMPSSRSFKECRDHPVSVFDLFDELASDGAEVPVGWQVTSDSLAAWAARRLSADRLILVKSAGDDQTKIAEAVERGWVDGYFPTASAGLRVEWLNALQISQSATCIDGPSP
jgi:aspartokinase-like uncharacterized kinase